MAFRAPEDHLVHLSRRNINKLYLILPIPMVTYDTMNLYSPFLKSFQSKIHNKPRLLFPFLLIKLKHFVFVGLLIFSNLSGAFTAG
jgi:hypothetical protein